MISFQELNNLERIFKGSNIGWAIVLNRVLFLLPITAYSYRFIFFAYSYVLNQKRI